MNYIDIVLVKHTETGRPFLFQAPFNSVHAGDTVICETMHSEQSGVVVESQSVLAGSETYNFAVLAACASEPLKRVLAKVQTRDLWADGSTPYTGAIEVTDGHISE